MNKELIKIALFEVFSEFKAKNDDDIKEWITVKGNHIPIKKGQSKENAVKKFFSDKTSKKIKNIPTDENGYSLKLKRIQRPSQNMIKALKKGFYPVDAIIPTLPLKTNDGKLIEKLLNENAQIKTNYKLKYLYKNDNENDYVFDYHTGDMIKSNAPVFFESKEDLERYKNKNKDSMTFEKEEEVKEWHHYYGGNKSYLINVNKLKELGFNIDISTAYKEFKFQS